VGAVQPQRLIYIAVDGPAPRAKMTQQRGRRFKAAKEAAAGSNRSGRWFDSNAITPGTEFMATLGRWLRHWLHQRVTNDPLWSGLEVILSDAAVPGEGEHKVMAFIRSQRRSVQFNANLTHCIHGLDADLVMLALASHEPRFLVLRDNDREEATASGIEFKCLSVGVMREYLAKDLSRGDFSVCPTKPGTLGGFDLENAIDDFVFMLFLVGNDFLPHMPGLHIHSGAIDAIMEIYVNNISKFGGYLTSRGAVNMERAMVLFQLLGTLEDGIFTQEHVKALRQAENQRPAKRQRTEEGTSEIPESEQTPCPVKYHEPGWKERYYQAKLKMSTHDAIQPGSAVEEYIRGLAWVMLYYYHGVPDWHWFYPYHYAPFSSDLAQFSLDKPIQFAIHGPPPPLLQLMAVLPPASSSLVPSAYRALMTADNSPLAEWMPADFEEDLDGKRYTWQGIALLPFLNFDTLESELKPLDSQLAPEEGARTRFGPTYLYVHSSHKLAATISAMQRKPRAGARVSLLGLARSDGFIVHYPSSVPIGQTRRPPDQALDTVQNNQTLSALFKDPAPAVPSPVGKLLDGCVPPVPALHQYDEPEINWRAQVYGLMKNVTNW